MVPLLVAAAVAAAGGIGLFVYKHWDEVCAWFSKFLMNLKEAISKSMQGIANAATIVGEKIKDGIARIKHQLFYKDKQKDQWMMERTVIPVSEEEVPPHIRAKIARQEADITQEMELELGQTV